MTPTDLAEMQRIAEAALEHEAARGEWRHVPTAGNKNPRVVVFEEIVSEYSPTRSLASVSATVWRPHHGKSVAPIAAFIAAANPTVILTLIAEVERLRAALKDISEMTMYAAMRNKAKQAIRAAQLGETL